MSNKYGWWCIGHHPTKWGYGVRDGDYINDVKATVERREDGSWFWRVWLRQGGMGGVEPSRRLAMTTANEVLGDLAGIGAWDITTAFCPNHDERPICRCGQNTQCSHCGQGRGAIPCECLGYEFEAWDELSDEAYLQYDSST